MIKYLYDLRVSQDLQVKNIHLLIDLIDVVLGRELKDVRAKIF